MESLNNILINFFTEGTNDILAGFLVPFIIWLLIKGYNFLTSINSYKKYSNLIGEYFFYHYSPTGRDEIIEGKLTIKSFMGHLSVIATSYEFEYTGSIEIERNLYIKLTATNFHEHWTFIFPEPTPIKQVESIWGIASGVSPIYEPVAYKVLLNRKPISNKKILQEEFSHNVHGGNKALIRVNLFNNKTLEYNTFDKSKEDKLDENPKS